MRDFSCCHSRRSLSERINEIIAKYDYPASCSPITPSLRAAYSKTSLCPRLMRATCRPSGICCLEPRSVKLWPFYHPQSSLLTRCSSICFKPWSSAQCSSSLPPICLGPNLKEYLTKKAICPSLRGKLCLYDNLLQRCVTPISQKSEPKCSYSTPCYPPKCRSVRFCNEIIPLSLDKSLHKTKCPLTYIPRTCQTSQCRSSMILKSNFRIPVTTCCEICSDLMMPASTCCRKRRRLAALDDPPYSSPILEREFKSRFLKIETCSCTPEPKLDIEFNNKRFR